MDKNLNKSAYSLFARSKYDYAQEVQDLHCAFLCDLSTRAKTFILSLVIAITVLATTGMAGMNVYAETGTVRVATFDQLRVALEDTQGVKKIVVDPQAAADDGDVIYSVENDENSDAFYIGFDAPLTVSHDITITSADDVDVFFARSDSFRRDQGNPALFNIDRTGNLKLEGLITMTGEEVTTAYNDREFVFSIKSRDGTGDDNDAWNRGQVLKGGFYIQNNGGEYNLGDDVILEDFHTTDDVEGVEPIHEKETNSLFGAKKSDEEATEEKEEETVVAPAPKRLMKNALMGNTPTRGGDTNNTDNIRTVDSWKQLKDLFESSDYGFDTVVITKNIVATSEVGTIFLRGRTVTIKGPDNEDVHIYRDAKGANFPLFQVQNENNTLTLGDNLILSGKTYTPAKTLDDFVVEGESGTAGKGTLTHAGGSLGIGKVSSHHELLNNGAASEFDVSGGYVKATIENVDYYAKHENWSVLKFFTGTPNDQSLQVGYLDDDKNFVKLTKEPADGTKLYILAQGFGYLGLDANNVLCSKDSYGNFFNADNALELTYTKKGKWKIGDTTYTDSAAAQKAVDDYNKNNGLPKENDKTWTSGEFTSGSSVDDPNAFFVKVKDGGTLNIEGAILEYFVTDENVKNAAPVTVSGSKNGKKSSLNMKSGEIRNNTVGYGAKEAEDSQKSVQELGTLIRDTDPTNTAGGVIFSNGAVGNFTEKAKILSNRADAGALIVTSNATVTMEDSTPSTKDGKQYELEFSKNIGWHHSGAVLVENGGTFNMKDGSINNNIAWWKGGAVWATEYGTTGLVRWNQYPDSMHNESKHDKGGNFVMTGGELDSNFANARAGALEVESDGVQLYGGTISNNRCKSLGGGIYIEGDSPIYSYTLTLKNGFISYNESVGAVARGELDKRIENGELKPGEDYNTTTDGDGMHRDGDWANWGDKHTGDGGGVWLCAMGGTSIFTSRTGEQVIIDNNIASRNGGTNGAKDNGWGDDFYISHRQGSALVQNMTGKWYNDTKDKEIKAETGAVLRGPMGMVNEGKPGGGDYSESDATGIKIINNMGRNGGGIACNGTIIMGHPEHVYRYNSEFIIEKDWDTENGLNERSAKVKLYYEYGVNEDGTPKLHPLVQTETGEAYEVVFGTNKDIVTNPNGNELIYKFEKNKAKATVPAKIKHGEEEIKLYEIYNEQESGKKIVNGSDKEFIDIDDKDDLKALFTYISPVSPATEVDLKVKWNIVVKEEESNEFIGYPKDVIVKASKSVGDEIVLNDPDKGGQLTKFNIFFNTVKFSQKLENKPKPWFVKGSYLDENVRINDAKFKLYHAKEDDSTTSSGARVYKADFSEGKGEVVNGVNYSTTDARYYLNITPPKTGTDLYLLFETKARDGYILPKAPWGIKYHADGTYEAFRFNDTAAAAFETKYKNIDILTQKELSKLEILCTEISVPIGADHKINNDKNEPIKLTKVKGTSATNLSTDVKIAGAKFRLYTTTENPANSGIWYKAEEVEPKQELVSDSNGEITLPRIVSRTPGKWIVYWLEETQAAPGYVKNPAPWLIWVTDGEIKNLRYADPSKFDGNKVVRGEALDGYIEIPSKEYIHNEPIEFKKVSASDPTRTLSNVKFQLYSVKNWNNGCNDTEAAKGNWANWKNNQGADRVLQIGSPIGSQVTSGQDGTFKLPLEGAGAYFIKEVNPVPGYKTVENPWLLVLNEDGTYKLGHSTSPDAKDGNDYWKPTKYTLCDNLTLTNERKPIELTKVDENGAAITSGATFVLTKAALYNGGNNWYVMEGRGHNDKTLEDSSAAVFGTKRTYTTNESGKLVIDDLPHDGHENYLLFETSAPTGFDRTRTPWLITVQDNETGRTVQVSKIKDKYKNKYKDQRGDTQTIPVTAGSQQKSYEMYWPGGDNGWFEPISVNSTDGTFHIANEPKYLTKVDLISIDSTDPITLAGAKFHLYGTTEEDYNRVHYIRRDEDKLNLQLDTTVSDGKIKLPSSVTTANGAKYFLVEDQNGAPGGYEPDTLPWLLEVNNGNIRILKTKVASSLNNSQGNWWKYGNSNSSTNEFKPVSYTDSYRIPNTRLPISLYKVNGLNTSEKLGGAKFRVYKTSEYSYNNHVYYETVHWDKYKDVSSLPNTGEIVFPYTTGGYYLVEELSPPDGFKIDNKYWMVWIDTSYGYSNATAYVFKAERYTDDVYKFHDNMYSNECARNEIPNYPSVNLEKVDLATVDVSQVTDGTGKVTKVTYDINQDTDRLNGVGFKLYNVSGNAWTQGTQVTIDGEDSNKIIWTKKVGEKDGVLELGSLGKNKRYILVETNPKEGYMHPTKEWHITIGNDGKISKVEAAVGTNDEYVETNAVLTNVKHYTLPKSGGMGTYWFMIIGMGMMTFAVTTLLTRKFEKKKL